MLVQSENRDSHGNPLGIVIRSFWIAQLRVCLLAVVGIPTLSGLAPLVETLYCPRLWRAFGSCIIEPLKPKARGPRLWAAAVRLNHLVDPASSHMLVSKIKPCMSKYKLLYGETANGSLKQL